jgi:hypothetical protein
MDGECPRQWTWQARNVVLPLEQEVIDGYISDNV